MTWRSLGWPFSGKRSKGRSQVVSKTVNWSVWWTSSFQCRVIWCVAANQRMQISHGQDGRWSEASLAIGLCPLMECDAMGQAWSTCVLPASVQWVIVSRLCVFDLHLHWHVLDIITIMNVPMHEPLCVMFVCLSAVWCLSACFSILFAMARVRLLLSIQKKKLYGSHRPCLFSFFFFSGDWLWSKDWLHQAFWSLLGVWWQWHYLHTTHWRGCVQYEEI